MHGVLQSVGYKAESFASAEQLLERDGAANFACLITDLKMPGMNGLALQAALARAGSRIPIIFVSAQRDEAARMRALGAGAVGFLHKPFDDEALIAMVRAALAR